MPHVRLKATNRALTVQGIAQGAANNMGARALCLRA